MCRISDRMSAALPLLSLHRRQAGGRHQQQQARNKRQLFQSAVCSEETSCDTAKNLFAIMGNYAPAARGWVTYTLSRHRPVAGSLAHFLLRHDLNWRRFQPPSVRLLSTYSTSVAAQLSSVLSHPT